jgi:hypothetical protein
METSAIERDWQTFPFVFNFLRHRAAAEKHQSRSYNKGTCVRMRITNRSRRFLWDFIQEAAMKPGMIETEPELSEDLLRGAAAISQIVYGDRGHRRKIYYLWATSKAPFFKFGSMICARKSVLLMWIKDQERQRSGQSFNHAESTSTVRA